MTVTAGADQPQRDPVKALPVKLEIDGRLVDTRTGHDRAERLRLGDVPAVTVAAPMRATVRAGTDALAIDNDFHFVLSPSRPVSVLVIQAEGAAPISSFYLTTALVDRHGAAVQDRRASRRRA